MHASIVVGARLHRTHVATTDACSALPSKHRRDIKMDSIAETLSVDIASPTTELRRNRNRARERAMREQTSEEARQTRKLTKRTGVKGLLCHWRHSKTPSLNCINVLNDLYTDWGGNDIATVAGIRHNIEDNPLHELSREFNLDAPPIDYLAGVEVHLKNKKERRVTFADEGFVTL